MSAENAHDQTSDSKPSKSVRRGSERRPRKLREFGIRLLSGVALGVIVAAALIAGGIWWALVASAIASLATVEFYGIVRKEHRKPNELFGLIAVAVMPLATWWSMSDADGSRSGLDVVRAGLLGLTATLAVLVVAALLWHLAFTQVTSSDTALTVFGVMYVGFTLTHLVLMRGLDSGTEFVAVMIASVWANDILAYAIGVPFGRHKLAPHVSPKKSWEGLAAGTVGTMAIWLLLDTVVQTNLPLWWLGLIGASISVAAVLGDLAESRIKREVGVKDSGKLLPGHGGFLDRIDSMILASVVAYYLLVLGMQLFGTAG